MSDHRPQVAIVTGASRGAGKGIAIGLGSRGMTVYVTGREKSESGGRMLGRDLPGTLEETATAVTRAGGKGIGVVCDSARDDELRALVERVTRETGRLDILHNNATFIHDRLVEPGPFWEKPLEFVRIIDVGLRSAYVASWYAAPVMVRQGSGLISFSSSFGGTCYMHGPAYGAQKAGVDKLAADMAVDLENTGVAAVSLWLGPQKTERSAIAVEEKPEQYTGFMAVAETPEFNGRVLYALACDPKSRPPLGADADHGGARAGVRHPRRGWPGAALLPRGARRAPGAAPGPGDVSGRAATGANLRSRQAGDHREQADRTAGTARRFRNLRDRGDRDHCAAAGRRADRRHRELLCVGVAVTAACVVVHCT